MTHLCDANVFVAMALGQHVKHAIAAAWFRDLKAADTAAFCRATQMTFLRLLTQKIAENYQRQTNLQALEAYGELSQDEAVEYLEEPPGVENYWRQLAGRDEIAPKVWMDAYLAAFAIAGGLRFVTLDHGFKHYETHGLDLLLLNP